MSAKLRGKKVLVAGGGNDIGLASAMPLQQHDALVAIRGRNRQSLDDAGGMSLL